MVKRAEIYANHRLISKIKIHTLHEDKEIVISPKSTNDFLFFYPEEKLSIHYLNEHGIVFIYEVLFIEINLGYSSIRYSFSIIEQHTYGECANKIIPNMPIQALLSDFRSTFKIEILEMSDKDLKIKSSVPLPKDFVEVFYYVGKKKHCLIGEIYSEEIREDFCFYELLIFRKEVI